MSYLLKVHTDCKWELELEPLEPQQAMYSIQEEAQLMETQVGINW